MKADFTKGLSEGELLNLKRLWKETGMLREILSKALEAKLISTISQEDSVNMYEDANWNLRIADSKGYRRGIKYAIELLNQRESAE